MSFVLPEIWAFFMIVMGNKSRDDIEFIKASPWGFPHKSRVFDSKMQANKIKTLYFYLNAQMVYDCNPTFYLPHKRRSFYVAIWNVRNALPIFLIVLCKKKEFCMKAILKSRFFELFTLNSKPFIEFWSRLWFIRQKLRWYFYTASTLLKIIAWILEWCRVISQHIW